MLNSTLSEMGSRKAEVPGKNVQRSGGVVGGERGVMQAMLQGRLQTLSIGGFESACTRFARTCWSGLR